MGRQATPIASLAPVLALVTVFVSMSTMCAERLSGLALLHAYRDTRIDRDKVVQEFCARKPADWDLNSQHLNANLPLA